MGNRLYEENAIRDIAVAIREKNGTNNTYNVSEMGDAVRAISAGGGGITPSGTITITTNGTHEVTQYASALVNVASGGGGSSDLPSNVKIGVLELEENSTTAVTVTHGSGVIPRAIALLPLTTVTEKGTTGGMVIDGVIVGHSNNNFSTSVTSISNITEQTFDFTPRSASYPLIGGHSYLWVAIS